jgi:hypothetical protein
MSTKEMFNELVTDAELLYATPLSRAVVLYQYIATAQKRSADAVFADVVDAKEQKTGNRAMAMENPEYD